MVSPSMTRSLVRVRVVGEDGQPVPQALVTIVSSSVPVAEIALVPDGSGLVSLQLPSGERFSLIANCFDRRIGSLLVSTPVDRDDILAIIVRAP